MSRFKLIPDLESLNMEDGPEFEEIEVPEDIDAAMLLTMEADDEVEEEFAAMDGDDEIGEDVETAIERLENLADVIREYGISGPMMKAADPYRELVEAGICKDYEELSVEFVKDDNSEAIAVALDNTVASTEAAGALVVSGGTALAKTGGAAAAGGGLLVPALIAAAAIALTALTVKVAKSMATHKGALKSVQAKLGAANAMNDEKFKVQTKNVLSKDEFGKAIKGADTIIKVTAADTLIKIAADIEAAIASGVTEEKINGLASKAGSSLKALNTQDIKDIFGLEISEGDDGIGVIKSKAAVVKSKGNLGEKGWSTGDAKAAVDSAMRVTSEGESLAKGLKAASANLNKVAGSLKKKAKVEGVDKAVAKNAVNKIKKLTNNYKALVKVAVNAVYKVNGTAVQVAKAALSTEGK